MVTRVIPPSLWQAMAIKGGWWMGTFLGNTIFVGEKEDVN